MIKRDKNRMKKPWRRGGQKRKAGHCGGEGPSGLNYKLNQLFFLLTLFADAASQTASRKGKLERPAEVNR